MRTSVDFRNALTAALRYMATLRNPWSLFILTVSNGHHTLRLRTGLEIQCPPVSLSTVKALLSLVDNGAVVTDDELKCGVDWVISPHSNRIVTPSGIAFTLESVSEPIFTETFTDDIHFAGFDLSGKIVIDVGAYVGDTALYYAQLGARVIALEPDPSNFTRLQENLSLNPELAQRVTPFREALGRDGVVKFGNGLGGASRANASSGHIMEVQSVSLRSIFRRLSIDHGYLLKMDCKGCEEQILNQEEAARFDRVAIEYDHSSPGEYRSQISARLRALGYRQIRVFMHHRGSVSLGCAGIVEGMK